MNSFISWIGGKKLLRKQILEQFPDLGSYSRYIEVFGGAGWVLFSKDKHAPLEVFNDVNGELINLYRVVKYHPETLQKELEWLLMSREQFFDELSRNTRGMTDIQRAARFFCLIRESFGTDCKSFRVCPRDMQKAVDYLKEVSGRLNRVVIENQDFERLIKTYDRPDALFYLDPPYYEAEKYYPDRFNPEDHERLQRCLGNIKGKFVLSYNDCQQIRDLFEGYTIIEVDRMDNLVNKDKSRRYKELIIKNYE
ncbi:DNA adenine methylase Dam [Lacrimispora xylanisolvens]|uniref:site-specific DNA-methyltransferase (adenine-specific) n=1 Tax=Lacrimispora xylanisolvens TaxID=384636 RepID=A0A2S6HJ72_9FIRM|nr:DNA adenine methylase [Hungatella xylanolytica]PPK77534.1 DNA adenine methylase Dam [Hungatella xylanolytica]